MATSTRVIRARDPAASATPPPYAPALAYASINSIVIGIACSHDAQANSYHPDGTLFGALLTETATRNYPPLLTALHPAQCVQSPWWLPFSLPTTVQYEGQIP